MDLDDREPEGDHRFWLQLVIMAVIIFAAGVLVGHFW